jgi:hypothetical protein
LLAVAIVFTTLQTEVGGTSDFSTASFGFIAT